MACGFPIPYCSHADTQCRACELLYNRRGSDETADPQTWCRAAHMPFGDHLHDCTVSEIQTRTAGCRQLGLEIGFCFLFNFGVSSWSHTSQGRARIMNRAATLVAVLLGAVAGVLLARDPARAPARSAVSRRIALLSLRGPALPLQIVMTSDGTARGL